jgi:hypothetical protein
VDGRYLVVALTIVLPAILVGVTVAWFSSNPISMFILFSVMLVGGLYLLSYTDTFSATPTEGYEG